MFDDVMPILSTTLQPPVIRGAAFLADAVARGVPVGQLLTALSGPFETEAAMLAAAFDTAVLSFLSNRRELGLALQRDVLANCCLFRVDAGPGRVSERPLRLLAFAAPGDLQMNMPIEFIIHHLDMQLDIVFVQPGLALPLELPDHDIAICLISDSAPGLLMRLLPLLAQWPRPVVNDPGRLAGGRIEDLTRDGIARLFASVPGITAPATVLRTRDAIDDVLAHGRKPTDLLPSGKWPILARPVGSHAGRGLERISDPQQWATYLESLGAEDVYLSCFVDYRAPDGLYRKLRIALIDGAPFLCHMAISDHWMIHYLNAGMDENADKRADEARMMAAFDEGFARRHAEAFAALHARLGLDYVIIDCAEAPDGTLLLFEVEMAAIIHMLDPIERFGYKQPQMRRVFSAFDALVQRRAQRVTA